MSNGASLEMNMVIWDEDTDERIEVGEDGEGLGLMEIRFLNQEGKMVADLRFPPDRSELVVEAIRKVSEFMRTRDER